MAVAYITEIREMGRMAGGQEIMAPLMPPVAEQAVTFTTDTASSAFNAATKAVRILCDANAHVEFGSAPTATTANMKVMAGVAEYFVVRRGDKVAFVTGT